MTAFIEGAVQTPTGRIVPMTINAKPIPDPGKLADGNVIVEGNPAAGVRTPISVALHPGRYRLRVYTPSGLLAEREMDLAEGQHVTAFIEGAVQAPSRKAGIPCRRHSRRPLQPIGWRGLVLCAQKGRGSGYASWSWSGNDLSHSRRYSDHAFSRRRLRIARLRSMLRSRLRTSSHSSSRSS